MRIAFIHPGALGDLILALPTLQTLASEEAERIDLFASAGRERFLAGRTVVTEGHSLDNAALGIVFAERLDRSAVPPAAAAAFEDFEDIINTYPTEPFVSNLAKVAKARIRHLEVRPSAVESSRAHASEFLHRQLFGMLVEVPLAKVNPTDEDTAAAAKVLGDKGGRPLVVVHPGSGGKAKCWPIDAFGQVAARLAEGGWNVVFVLGEAETERETPTDCSALAGKFKVLSDLTLGQLAGLIASADAYLGNDSGPTHLAAAVGVPTIALFGPTNPDVWGPRGRGVKVFRGDSSEAGCWAIAPASVAEAVLAAAAQ